MSRISLVIIVVSRDRLWVFVMKFIKRNKRMKMVVLTSFLYTIFRPMNRSSPSEIIYKFKKTHPANYLKRDSGTSAFKNTYFVKHLQNICLLDTWLHQKTAEAVVPTCKKAVPKVFLNLTGKHLHLNLLLIKLHASVSKFLERDSNKYFCSCEFCEIFKNTFLIEYLQVTWFMTGRPTNW